MQPPELCMQAVGLRNKATEEGLKKNLDLSLRCCQHDHAWSLPHKKRLFTTVCLMSWRILPTLHHLTTSSILLCNQCAFKHQSLTFVTTDRTLLRCDITDRSHPWKKRTTFDSGCHLKDELLPSALIKGTKSRRVTDGFKGQSGIISEDVCLTQGFCYFWFLYFGFHADISVVVLFRNNEAGIFVFFLFLS